MTNGLKDAVSYCQHMKDVCGDDHLDHSAADSLEQWFEQHNPFTTPAPGVILEIGTFHGASTAVLAQYASLVITIDVVFRARALQMWQRLGLLGRICHVVVPDNGAKAKAVARLNFNMAFIDGKHDRGNVKFDYGITKKCGHLLFHDFDEQHPGVTDILTKIGATKHGVLGEWKNAELAEEMRRRML